MKRKSIGIKWHIFLFIFLFSAIFVGLLWLFQIVYLDEFYKYIKSKQGDQTFKALVRMVEEQEEDLEDEIHELARENSVAILVVDSEINTCISAEYSIGTSLRNMPLPTFLKLKQAASDNGGSVDIFFAGGQNMNFGKPMEPHEFPNDMMNPEEIINPDEDLHKGFHQVNREMNESAVHVAILEVNGVEYVIMMNMVLTPVHATVETLKIQLVVISVFIILIGIIVSIFASRVIAKPIIKTNEAAKRLAEGDYSVDFNDYRYKEIGELSHTLNYAARELERTEEFRRELLANVSHDLRTPLTMITGYAEVMRDLPGENTPENVQVVIDEANRLTNLVNDMLDISKLQAGVLELSVSDYNLTDSVHRVLKRYNKLREQEGYVIDFQADEEVFVRADEDKIYQVLYNLINNAINYTGEDKTVRVKQIRCKNVVRMEICDSGKGLPEEEMEHVWERYYKVDKTHKRSVQGTGLGLSIVKNILKLHNSDFGVRCDKEEGTVFWFTLNIISKHDKM